ncbi:hypothetical protein KC19_2G233600 [Ceratodon purpureus]|uniref:TF-B3 domain-containing protein n=1 Tax=Ceratodon purpureus TaxID=3225 RepID=A0A8T0IX59_CERPU|nr:hypothetical protein KC19_2G233600 [Ceratodon purpureus]
MGNQRNAMSLDEKPEVLRKLQGHIHFEKTITATSAPGHVGHNSRLALPMAFVKQHGDKFQKNVLLQTVLSSKAWPVRLEICFMTTKYTTQIKFSGGWRAFADFNGLQEGDSLIFLLTAMSKFEVYLIGSTRCPTELPAQAQRKRTFDSLISQKIAAKQSHDYKEEQSSTDENIEDAAEFSGLRVAMKSTVTGEHAIKDIKSKNFTTSANQDAKDGQGRALDHDKVMEPGTSGGRNYPGDEFQGPVIQNITTNLQSSGYFENQAGSRNLSTDVIGQLSTDVKTEVLRKLQGRIYFEKTVTASTASGYPSRDPKLAMPSQFVHSHGDKFRKSVILRVTSSSREWPVKLSSAPQFCFRGGWRAFAEFNGLLEGDSLIFSLIAVSEFEVYVFSSSGSPKKPPDSQSAASSGCIDAGIARKKAKHSDVCKNELVLVEESVEGGVKLEEVIAKKKTTGREQHAVSSSGHIPTSLRNSAFSKDSKPKNVTKVHDSTKDHHHGPKMEQEHTFYCDQDMVPGASGGRENSVNEHQGPTIQKIARDFQPPGFFKRLTVVNVGNAEKTPDMEVPAEFWKAYGSRLGSVVKLQGIREESQVRTMDCSRKYGMQPRIFLRSGWSEFATENNLEVGQELLFTLTADSYFVVRELMPPPRK